MPLFDLALNLAAFGLPVFPCGAKKFPCIAKAEGGNGFHDATTDPETIRKLFAHPGARLIGVPTGERSGIDVLDLDYAKGAGSWESTNLPHMPETRIHGSRSGGRHYLFRHEPGVRNSESKIGPGVDVRGQGGYVIWWPTHGISVQSDGPIGEWPNWLLAAMSRFQGTRRREDCLPIMSAEPQDQFQTFIEATLNRVRRAAEGTKHETLRNAALLLGGIAARVGFADAEAVQWLLDALPNTVKDIANARRTAEWGLTQGRERPIDISGKRNGDRHDPRRSAIARIGCGMLRRGLSGRHLATALITHNARQPNPLPECVVNDTARWAIRQYREVPYAG